MTAARASVRGGAGTSDRAGAGASPRGGDPSKGILVLSESIPLHMIVRPNDELMHPPHSVSRARATRWHAGAGRLIGQHDDAGEMTMWAVPCRR